MQLALWRRREPALDDALALHGMPSPGLLKRMHAPPASYTAVYAGLDLDKQEAEQTAAMLLTSELWQRLADDGFVQLQGLVPKDLVDAALRRVNEQLGQAARKEPGACPAMAHDTHPAITDLFNRSLLPYICQIMLGDATRPSRQGAQVALRFPGDYCGPARHVTSEHARSHFQQWHIDGCAVESMPEQQHYGTIKNFDVLVGVLLADVSGPFGGELVVWPGSHYVLAEHFARVGLGILYEQGVKGLPNGAQTERLFARPVHHCTGRAGDVVLANYMTAHAVAPNSSPDIRYAVYFRVHGQAFGPKPWVTHQPQAMLEPWLHWKGLHARATIP